MGIYNRSDNLPQEVASLRNIIDEIKQTQVIGNDNLIVNFYGASSLIGYNVSAGSTAIFKTTFTFDVPSDNYVQIFNYWSSSVATVYHENRYSDPATVNDNTKKAFYMLITPVNATTLSVMEPIIKSSDSGTLLFERIA